VSSIISWVSSVREAQSRWRSDDRIRKSVIWTRRATYVYLEKSKATNSPSPRSIYPGVRDAYVLQIRPRCRINPAADSPSTAERGNIGRLGHDAVCRPTSCLAPRRSVRCMQKRGTPAKTSAPAANGRLAVAADGQEPTAAETARWSRNLKRLPASLMSGRRLPVGESAVGRLRWVELLFDTPPWPQPCYTKQRWGLRSPDAETHPRLIDGQTSDLRQSVSTSLPAQERKSVLRAPVPGAQVRIQAP
jgi:hypothetical protein